MTMTTTTTMRTSQGTNMATNTIIRMHICTPIRIRIPSLAHSPMPIRTEKGAMEMQRRS